MKKALINQNDSLIKKNEENNKNHVTLYCVKPSGYKLPERKC